MDQDKTSKNDTFVCLTFDFKSIEKGDFSEEFWTDIMELLQTPTINCLGLRDLCPAVGWQPVNKVL